MSAIKNENLKSLDQFVTEEYGERGTEEREAFESGYEEFKFGYMLKQARLKKGMTQEELAQKVGTNKGYISRIENNIKDVRISTLQKIIEKGFGGQLELVIKM